MQLLNWVVTAQPWALHVFHTSHTIPMALWTFVCNCEFVYCGSSQQCTKHTCSVATASIVPQLAALKQGFYAGVISIMAQHADADPLHDGLLRDLTTAFTINLQVYKIRAEKYAQSFEHMVLLEAAVQGWYVAALLLVPSFSDIACGRRTKSSFLLASSKHR